MDWILHARRDAASPYEGGSPRQTDEALRLSREIRQGIAEFEAVLTAGLTQEERRELLRLLHKIEGNVDAASASGGRPARKGEKLC